MSAVLRPASLVLSAILLLSSCRAGSAPKAPAPWIDPSPHVVSFVTVAPDVSLEVLDWGGTGPALVFLSGLQDVAHGFDDFAPAFAQDHHVIGITRRGYGASSQPATGYDLATRVADLRAVLDSLGLQQVSLVGHSIAGDELTAFAGEYPDRVTSLVYLDAAYDHSGLDTLLTGYPAPPPMTAADSASPQAVARYYERVSGMLIPEAQYRAIGRYGADGHLLGDVTPAAIDAQMLAGAGHPNYSRVKAPALLIYAVVDSAPELFPSYASYDSATKAQATAFTARLNAWARPQRAAVGRELAMARVVLLEGANHYVFLSDKGEVEGLMRGF